MGHEPRHADNADPAKGTMELSEHLRTWHYFTVGVKWTVIASAVVAILLAIFRTN